MDFGTCKSFSELFAQYQYLATSAFGFGVECLGFGAFELTLVTEGGDGEKFVLDGLSFGGTDFVEGGVDGEGVERGGLQALDGAVAAFDCGGFGVGFVLLLIGCVGSSILKQHLYFSLGAVHLIPLHVITLCLVLRFGLRESMTIGHRTRRIAQTVLEAFCSKDEIAEYGGSGLDGVEGEV